MPGAIAALGALMAGLFLLPVVAGLAGTLLPAFGFLPAAGGHEFSRGASCSPIPACGQACA